MITRQGMLAADAGSEATTFREDEISVLIGSDIYWDVVTGQITRLSPQITAKETLFGLTIQGTLSNLAQGSRTRATSLFIAVGEATESDTALDIRITNLWCIDSLDVQDSPDGSQSDSIVLALFENDVFKKGKHYEVPVLLRERGLETRQSNYDLAKQRLLMQLRRFRQQPDLLARYDDTNKAYFNESHAERVPANDTVPNTYYMANHGVIRRDAVTTKLRVVFDASSHAPGQPSLNNVLMKGPKMDADLLKILLNVIMHPIIMVADIKKPYRQISSRPEDRHALRFLWVVHLPTQHEPFPPILHWRMTRVPFGAKSSPFLLAATLHQHFRVSEERFPETVEWLRQSFYVDDLVVGADNLQTAQRIYSEARIILVDAGMELRKWVSKSSLLREQFRTDRLSLEDEDGDPHRMKVLRLCWERDNDSVIGSADHVIKFASTISTTKRTTLQGFASLYDPLGFLTPFTVRAKLISKISGK